MSEWIVKQNPDGQLEVVSELIRCKDCEYAVNEYGDGECYCDSKNTEFLYIGKDWNHYCGWAKRKEK